MELLNILATSALQEMCREYHTRRLERTGLGSRGSLQYSLLVHKQDKLDRNELSLPTEM